jgi:hypothetical protein
MGVDAACRAGGEAFRHDGARFWRYLATRTPTLGGLENPMSSRCRWLIAVPLLGLVGAALAQDIPANLPKRKPGLWEMQTSGMGNQPQTTKLCLDADTDTAMYKMNSNMSGQMCSKFKIDVQGTNKVVTDAVCKIDTPDGTVNMSSHSETTFQGDTAYSTQGNIKYDPAIMGHAEMAMTSNGRWVGQCAAGQKPGDMIMANGQTFNIKDMPGH